jgi:hypothetical protein
LQTNFIFYFLVHDNPSVILGNPDLTKEEDDQGCTPPELASIAANAVSKLLPEKSRDIYNKVYDNFTEWCKENNVVGEHYTENVVLAYCRAVA